MTVGYCSTTVSTCDIYKIGIDSTHAVAVQFFGTEWFDLSATECVVLVPCELSRLSGILEYLENRVLFNRDRAPVYEIVCLFQEFDSACLRERDNRIL